MATPIRWVLPLRKALATELRQYPISFTRASILSLVLWEHRTRWLLRRTAENHGRVNFSSSSNIFQCDTHILGPALYH